MVTWQPDILGDDYTQHSIELGPDPDGEGSVVATLVKRTAPADAHAAVLYVHGYSDYYFNTDIGDFFADRGLAFFALDLRKCGRSTRDGLTPHFVTDLTTYQEDLNRALDLVREETGGLPVIVGAHSTGGLTLALWLDALQRSAKEDSGSRTGTRDAGVVGVFMNSPWFDLQGAAWTRSIGTQVIRALGRMQPKRVLELGRVDAYGTSIHSSRRGEWDFELDYKPMNGFPIRVGWLAAVRNGHARLHRGLDVGVPSLVMHSDRSFGAREYSERVDVSDVVLDVRQIARWAGCLGNAVSLRPIPKARHDVFLSIRESRDVAYETLSDWLDSLELAPASTPTAER